eukprot:TRINITY_DN2007_c0_g1_i12.p3 TRINITY_DN2007_c0_g1~~TRINITY_DN2007_c0_g1_i12.p3  ORF type:complete len:119 (-),score=4.84 TRINITY_DN2007_c0_g1_i12:298-654(-)
MNLPNPNGGALSKIKLFALIELARTSNMRRLPVEVKKLIYLLGSKPKCDISAQKEMSSIGLMLGTTIKQEHHQRLNDTRNKARSSFRPGLSQTSSWNTIFLGIICCLHAQMFLRCCSN